MKGLICKTCAFALNYIVSCNGLGMPKFSYGAFLGHTLSKVCQYLIIDDKIA
jgi:hypothetical protein